MIGLASSMSTRLEYSKINACPDRSTIATIFYEQKMSVCREHEKHTYSSPEETALEALDLGLEGNIVASSIGRFNEIE
jgi:hypothetical protein